MEIFFGDVSNLGELREQLKEAWKYQETLIWILASLPKQSSRTDWGLY